MFARKSDYRTLQPMKLDIVKEQWLITFLASTHPVDWKFLQTNATFITKRR